MGITYGDHLIDSGYHDITPEQELEIEAREICAQRGIDPDEICADGGVTAWMIVAQEPSEVCNCRHRGDCDGSCTHPKPRGEVMGRELAEARARLAENLASFDAEVAFELSNGGERADLWTEIDVNVEDLRAILDASAAAEKALLSAADAKIIIQRMPQTRKRDEALQYLDRADITTGTAEPAAWREFDYQTIDFVLRYGGRCRECADHLGLCPNGLPCDVDDAKTAIRWVLKALNYGIRNGFINCPIPGVVPMRTETAQKRPISTETNVNEQGTEGDSATNKLG